jgi:hypothetical protein
MKTNKHSIFAIIFWLAVVYRNGDFMALTDLVPDQPPVSFATGINGNGDVAGNGKPLQFLLTPASGR